VALGYDPDKEVVIRPGCGLFMKTLKGKAWERYASQASAAIIRKTLSEYTSQAAK
jgi:hypothetical protein